MSVDNISASSEKRGRRPTCAKCGQILTRNQFDKCIWCGQPVPDEFKFTAEEKNATLEKQQKRKLDLITKEKEKVKNPTEWSLF